MTTFRVRHQSRFTTIANEAIRDKSLSLKARGLHHILLSYPDDWEINEKHLCAHASDKDGRDAIRGGINELKAAGYIRKAQTRQGGRFSKVDYDIFELPQPDETPSPENPATGKPTADGKPGDGKTADGKPGDGATVDGKPDDILNTYSTNDLSGLNTEFTKAQALEPLCVDGNAATSEPEQSRTPAQPQPITSFPVNPADPGQDNQAPVAANSISREKNTLCDAHQPSTSANSISGEKKTWGGRFEHPAAKMTAYYQSAAAGQPAATGTRKFSVLQREKMSGLISIGDEAWELATIVDDSVEFTALAIAGARSIMPDSAPEARVKQHLINKSKAGSRTELRILIEAGRTVLAAQAAAVAQPVAAIAAPAPDLSTLEAYAREAQARCRPIEPTSAVLDVDQLFYSLYTAQETGIALRARRIALIHDIRSLLEMPAIETRIFTDLQAGKVEPAVAIALLQNPIKAENLAGKLKAIADLGDTAGCTAYRLLLTASVATAPPSTQRLQSFSEAAGLLAEQGDFDYEAAIAIARDEFERLGQRSESQQESIALEMIGISRWKEGSAAQLELLCSKLKAIPKGAIAATWHTD